MRRAACWTRRPESSCRSIMTKVPAQSDGIESTRDVPQHRPSERFWPYVDLPEQPTPEELAALDPDLRAALYGDTDQPFSVTLVFQPFDAPEYEDAVRLARAAPDYREIGTGTDLRHRARFFPGDVVPLRDLFDILDRVADCDVLIDDRPVPYARELWLPLLWFLIPH